MEGEGELVGFPMLSDEKIGVAPCSDVGSEKQNQNLTGIVYFKIVTLQKRHLTHIHTPLMIVAMVGIH